MPSALAVFIQFDFRGLLHRQVGAVVCLWARSVRLHPVLQVAQEYRPDRERMLD
jgi:hypothetical protein